MEGGDLAEGVLEGGDLMEGVLKGGDLAEGMLGWRSKIDQGKYLSVLGENVKEGLLEEMEEDCVLGQNGRTKGIGREWKDEAYWDANQKSQSVLRKCLSHKY